MNQQASDADTIEVQDLLKRLQSKIGELMVTISLLELKLETLHVSHEKELQMIMAAHKREITLLENRQKNTSDVANL